MWSDSPRHSCRPATRDAFEAPTSHRPHRYLVFRSHGCNFWTLHHMYPGVRLLAVYVVGAVRSLSGGIKWLHIECVVVYTRVRIGSDAFRARENELTIAKR